MEPQIYCRRCSYCLQGISSAQCPECGSPFDPANPATFRRRPKRSIWRRTRIARYFLLAVAAILGATWGWFYWGWRSEQQALAALEQKADAGATVEPLSPFWKKKLGPAGFVLDRVIGLGVASIFSPKPKHLNVQDDLDISEVSQFSHLQELDLRFSKVNDLTPLSRLTNLQRLHMGTAVVQNPAPLAPLVNLEYLNIFTSTSDLGFLKRMVHLKELYLDAELAQDLSPLTDLTEMENMSLVWVHAKDIQGLARMSRLKSLNLYSWGVADLRPLAGLSHLTNLTIWSPGLSDLSPLSGLSELQYLEIENEFEQELPPSPLDAHPLSALANLRELNLHCALVNDFLPLQNLKKLQMLNADFWQAPQGQRETLKQSLPDCKID